MIRILVADDHAMVREALATLLNLEKDLTVVGQVGTGSEVPAAVGDLDPDVVILDIEMPGKNGIDVARELRDSRVAVLIVTTFGRPGYLQRAMEAGAVGFLVKDAPATELADAVRKAARGERTVDPALAMESFAVGANPLTTREADVLRAASGGGTVADIARELHMGQGTCRNHLSAAMTKMRARTRAEAARKVEEAGWL
ncbi:MAG: response regulator transcription factor [Ancrocorticia sp.]|nr:response regulator transcription factor [Ancrocorticia sp.]